MQIVSYLGNSVMLELILIESNVDKINEEMFYLKNAYTQSRIIRLNQ